ncbi:unnamed protein product [Soboliphyme baturini]|uniref:CN hydrolase domain-containing protein n=1 Tax=Soboliphyme baturini TaxID=241478 RepID=A0A183I972_9BILA|nr:unnamed protein product [Soboliphyme baturini]
MAKYHKLHLFDVDISDEVRLRESDWVVPGRRIVEPVVTPIGKLGITTCYDLRFPELSGILRSSGAEILAFPSAFTVATGMAHWEVLLRGRAIDTQCYVVAAAQTAKHNAKRCSYGHAMVIDPWGTVVAQCSPSPWPQICTADVDLHFLEDVRKRLPVEQHRRRDVYVLRRETSLPETIQPQDSFPFGDKIIPSPCVFYVSSYSYAFVNRKPVVEGRKFAQAS